MADNSSSGEEQSNVSYPSDRPSNVSYPSDKGYYTSKTGGGSGGGVPVSRAPAPSSNVNIDNIEKVAKAREANPQGFKNAFQGDITAGLASGLSEAGARKASATGRFSNVNRFARGESFEGQNFNASQGFGGSTMRAEEYNKYLANKPKVDEKPVPYRTPYKAKGVTVTRLSDRDNSKFTSQLSDAPARDYSLPSDAPKRDYSIPARTRVKGDFMSMPSDRPMKPNIVDTMTPLQRKTVREGAMVEQFFSPLGNVNRAVGRGINDVSTDDALRLTPLNLPFGLNDNPVSIFVADVGKETSKGLIQGAIGLPEFLGKSAVAGTNLAVASYQYAKDEFDVPNYILPDFAPMYGSKDDYTQTFKKGFGSSGEAVLDIYSDREEGGGRVFNPVKTSSFLITNAIIAGGAKAAISKGRYQSAVSEVPEIRFKPEPGIRVASPRIKDTGGISVREIAKIDDTIIAKGTGEITRDSVQKIAGTDITLPKSAKSQKFRADLTVETMPETSFSPVTGAKYSRASKTSYMITPFDELRTAPQAPMQALPAEPLMQNIRLPRATDIPKRLIGDNSALVDIPQFGRESQFGFDVGRTTVSYPPIEGTSRGVIGDVFSPNPRPTGRTVYQYKGDSYISPLGEEFMLSPIKEFVRQEPRALTGRAGQLGEVRGRMVPEESFSTGSSFRYLENTRLLEGGKRNVDISIYSDNRAFPRPVSQAEAYPAGRGVVPSEQPLQLTGGFEVFEKAKPAKRAGKTSLNKIYEPEIFVEDAIKPPESTPKGAKKGGTATVKSGSGTVQQQKLTPLETQFAEQSLAQSFGEVSSKLGNVQGTIIQVPRARFGVYPSFGIGGAFANVNEKTRQKTETTSFAGQKGPQTTKTGTMLDIGLSEAPFPPITGQGFDEITSTVERPRQMFPPIPQLIPQEPSNVFERLPPEYGYLPFLGGFGFPLPKGGGAGGKAGRKSKRKLSGKLSSLIFKF